MHYVVSDPHGCYDSLMNLLKKVKFKNSDTLIIVGDAIDRGSKSKELLDFIFTQPNIIYLKGNHEEMMEGWLVDRNLNDRAWFQNGGDVVWSQIRNESDEYLNCLLKNLKSLPTSLELTVNNKKFKIGHACILDLKDTGLTLWGKHYENWNAQLSENEYGIVGHTETVHLGTPNKIKRKGNVFYIDCGAVYGYSLGILRLDDFKKFYVKTGKY